MYKFNFQDNTKFSYFNLALIGEIQINYSIDQYPTASFSCKASQPQVDCVLEAFEKRSLPYFLGIYEIRDIDVSREVDSLNEQQFNTLNFSCVHYLTTDLERHFTLTRPLSNEEQSTVSFDSGEYPVKVSQIEFVPEIKTPFKHYRYIRIDQYNRFNTTARDELNYMTTTQGLILEQRELVEKNIFSFKRYGKKIKEIKIDAGTILGAETSNRNNDVLDIFPTLISDLNIAQTEFRETSDSDSILDWIEKKDNLATSFYFSDIEITPANPVDFLASFPTNIENPYSTANLFSTVPQNDLNSTPTSPDLDIVENPDSETYKFSQFTALDFNSTQPYKILKKDEVFNGLDCDNIPDNRLNTNNVFRRQILNSFRVNRIDRNSEICLESGETSETDTINRDNRTFDSLAENGGETRRYTKICTKNGLPYTQLEILYGDYYKNFDENEYGIISYRLQTMRYRDIQAQLNSGVNTTQTFRRPIFRTVDGYDVSGYTRQSPQVPNVQNDSSIGILRAATVDNAEENIRNYYNQKFAAIIIPFSGSLTQEYELLTTYYKDYAEEVQPFPLEFIVKSTQEEDNRRRVSIYNPTIDENVVFNMGKLSRTINTVEITNVASRDTDIDRFVRYSDTLNIENTDNTGKRVTNSSYEEVEGRPQPVSYTLIN
jgi:hypothetical protein